MILPSLFSFPWVALVWRRRDIAGRRAGGNRLAHCRIGPPRHALLPGAAWDGLQRLQYRDRLSVIGAKFAAGRRIRAPQQSPWRVRSARTIKRLRHTCRHRMTRNAKFCTPARHAPSAVGRFVLASAHANPGRPDMTLALKWDVIAVCAVFVFVGAVLLGAF